MRERVTNALQVFALLALVVLIFSLALCASGCASTQKPSPPVKVPAPCIVAIAPLAAAELPAKPAYPHDADEGELKAWALKLGEVTEQRETILLARDAAWFEKVDAHNALVPACGEPVP